MSQTPAGACSTTLLDAVLALYQRYVTADVPLVQPTLSEIGRILLSRTRWNAAR